MLQYLLRQAAFVIYVDCLPNTETAPLLPLTLQVDLSVKADLPEDSDRVLGWSRSRLQVGGTTGNKVQLKSRQQ
jgi:hypothetical protein